MKGRREKQDPWLLIKEQDEFAKPGDASLPEDDVSVQSGRSMAEIAADAAPRAGAMPEFVQPQLATLAWPSHHR